MTTIRKSITVESPIDEVFAYVADFTNVAEWDPGVAASRRIDAGPVGAGSKFEVDVAFGSRRIPMLYEIVDYDPPLRVVLAGKAGKFTAVDTVVFASSPAGTRIDYTAELSFNGLMRLLTPFMGRVFDNVGEKAMRGLAAAFDSNDERT